MESEDENDRQDSETEEEKGRSVQVNPKGKKATRKRIRRPKDDRTDMYKAFEGPVLLCIGMLLQAHIVSSLVDKPPTDWVDELQDYPGVDAEDNDFRVEGSPRKRRVDNNLRESQEMTLDRLSPLSQDNEDRGDSPSDSEPEGSDSGASEGNNSDQ